jgi:hypothetical protein
MENGPCSATTLNGSAGLPFVISTGGVMGLRPTRAMKNGSCSATTVAGSAALPFVMSTGGVMGLRPTQGMKSGSCSANTVAGSAALPFVISTGAPKERSGEICGVSGPSLEMFFDRAYPDFLLRSTCQEHGSGFPLRKPHEDDQCHGSRQEIRRSVVERSAVSAVLPWECFRQSGPRPWTIQNVCLFSSYSSWKRCTPLCHLDRSSVGA